MQARRYIGVGTTTMCYLAVLVEIVSKEGALLAAEYAIDEIRKDAHEITKIAISPNLG